MKVFNKIILLFILFFALALRVYGINWDQNQHLHPDERFLTMTTGAMVWPETLAEYLSPSVSKLNPYNTGTMFYVYGTLPTTIVKYFSRFEWFDVFQYNNIALTGRLISAIFDIGVVYLIYLIAKNIFNQKTGLLAAFLYSISVLPIQLSHFFAVDTFLNFFLVLSFYFLVKLLDIASIKKTLSFPTRSGIHMENIFIDSHFSTRGGLSRGNDSAWFYSVLLSLSFGAALACKISALYFLPVILLGYLFYFLKFRPHLHTTYYILYTAFYLLLIACFASAAFRILDPHVFTGGLFPPKISPQFVQNIESLKSMGVKGSTFPPAIQWNNITPIIFPLKNIVLWGLGLPLGVLSVVAVIYKMIEMFIGFFKENNLKSFYNNLLVKEFNSVLILFWVLFLFFYQAVQPTPSMRYFLPIYPFVTILSARFSEKYLFPKFITSRILRTTFYILLLLYPLSFLYIYSRTHSRVSASEWIYQNIPTGSTLSCDAWDDCLPLSLGKGQVINQYKILTLEPFVPDSIEKVGKFESQLKEIDYLIFTSNRAWGSIPKWPEKFPYMVKFYEDLFAGKFNFEKVAEITSYPTIPILNIPIPDQSSEEAFTVYDHPKVLIYKNTQNN